MAFVDFMVRGITKIDAHSVAIVEESVVMLKRLPFTALLLGGKDGQMIMEFAKNTGFYLSAFGKGEAEEWLAIDETLSSAPISVNMTIPLNPVPRNALVSEEIAREVAAEFYHNGGRCSRRSWMRLHELD